MQSAGEHREQNMISGLEPVDPIAGNFSAIPHRFNDRREVTSTNTLNVPIGLGAAHITNVPARKGNSRVWTPFQCRSTDFSD